MRRFFVAPNSLSGAALSIDGELFAHIAKVLRMKPGDKLTLCDGTGIECEAVIACLYEEHLTVNMLQQIKQNRHEGKSPAITILQALPKGDKLDLIIEKSTELGAYAIIPFVSSRSVPRITPERLPKKLERWRKIAAEAARQSQRTDIPQLSFIDGLAGTLNRSVESLKLLLWEDERTIHLRDILEQTPRPASIDVLIGPEGGFSPEEANAAKAAGFTTVSLGQRILRTETASLAILAILQFYWGDVG